MMATNDNSRKPEAVYKSVLTFDLDRMTLNWAFPEHKFRKCLQLENGRFYAKYAPNKHWPLRQAAANGSSVLLRYTY